MADKPMKPETSPTTSTDAPSTPKDQGYDPENIDRELMAEAICGYMVNPWYVKEASPNVAKLIRTWANENPDLRKIIQFNTIGGATVLGYGQEVLD